MSNGLEDVVAAETVLSDVDGAAGRLVIRGVPLEALAGHATYAETLHLLWDGFFDDLPGPAELAERLGAARVAAFARLADTEGLEPFDAMRALIARLPDGNDLDTALMLAAAPAVFLPGVLRQRGGLAPIAPDAALPHSTDMLHMLTGTLPTPETAAALDTYLVTVSDHGLNASTFTARVVASTRAGLMSSTLAALGALKGPLHGGAPGPVLDMLDAIGTPGNAQPWIAVQLGAGERLMGFGHRIYRARDPRADALAGALERLKTTGNVDATRMALALAVENTALAALKQHKPGRPLLTNVEFYTALLLEAVGFPRDAFTAVFAA
ncbi:MAG: citrate synthase, partial [Devosia sp.]